MFKFEVTTCVSQLMTFACNNQWSMNNISSSTEKIPISQLELRAISVKAVFPLNNYFEMSPLLWPKKVRRPPSYCYCIWLVILTEFFKRPHPGIAPKECLNVSRQVRDWRVIVANLNSKHCRDENKNLIPLSLLLLLLYGNTFLSQTHLLVA